MYDELIQGLEEAGYQCVSGLNLDVFDVIVRKQGKAYIFEFIIDRPEGGITMDECVTVNRRLADHLDEINFMEEDYFIEVGSPGLDRPLKKLKDFLRVRGRMIHLYLSEKIEGRLEFVGKMSEIKDQSILIEFNDNMVTIPFALINKAVQEIKEETN